MGTPSTSTRHGRSPRSPSSSSGPTTTSLDYGDGNVTGSSRSTSPTGISPATRWTKPAKYCTADEIKTEVWEELKRSHSLDEQPLTDDMLYCWFLDPDITAGAMARLPPPRDPPTSPIVPMSENAEPLFVAYLNTWRLRPQAFTADLQLLPRLRLRAHLHLGGDDGGSERGGQTCRQRHHPALGPSSVACAGCGMSPSPTFAFIFRLDDHRRYQRGLPWKEPPFFVKGATKAITSAGPVAKSLRRVVTRS